MNIRVTAKYVDDFVRVLKQAPAIAIRNWALAMMAAVTKVKTHARQNHKFIWRTGKLERAITGKVDAGTSGALTGKVYINTGQAGAPYGPIVHEGSKPHIIKPKPGHKMLKWPTPNGFVWAKLVRHPGTKPDQFIYEAGEANKDAVQALFEKYTLRALKEAGL